MVRKGRSKVKPRSWVWADAPGKKTVSHTSKRKVSRRKKSGFHFNTWNTAIAILTIFCLGFIASTVQRYWRGGTRFGDSVDAVTPPRMMIDFDEQIPWSPVEVEVLNGCGVQGLGLQFTDFLRSNQIDVIRTENASRFDYETTIIIQRNEFMESSYRIAELLKIPRSDTLRIILQPDLSLETDVTLILGKDYPEIKPFQEFLSKQP